MKIMWNFTLTIKIFYVCFRLFELFKETELLKSINLIKMTNISKQNLRQLFIIGGFYRHYSKTTGRENQ